MRYLKSISVIDYIRYSMNKVAVEIPDTLYRRIKNLADELGVKDLSIFVTDLLRDAISKVEAEITKEEYTPDELEKIKDRLRSLGYLD